MQATITSKGQVTLPKPLRDQLHLGPGDKIEFLLEEGGSLRVIPVTSPVTRLKGMLPRPNMAVTLEEMEEAIVKGSSKR